MAIMKKTDKPHKKMEKVIFYDCECYTGEKEIDKENFEAVKKYKTYLICADYGLNTCVYQNVSETHEGYSENMCQDFWDDVISYGENSEVYIYAHWHNADILMSAGIPILQSLGFTEDGFSYKNPFFFNYVKGNTKLYLRDSHALFSCKLSLIGKTLGLLKGEFTDHHIKPTPKNLQERIDYCLQDVNIMKTATLNLESFIELENLGSMKMTGAGLCLQAFKQRFIEHDITMHNRGNAIVMEREAYSGGRTEVWKLGRHENLYYIDVHSMYPSVMRYNKYPVGMVGNSSISVYNYSDKERQLHIKNIAKLIKKGYLVTAIVKIKTDKPIYAKKTDTNTIFPVGEFYTGLNTPELKYALEQGHIKDITDYTVYDGEELFTNYVNYFYALRQKYKKEKNKFLESLCKLMLNALYGKFAQMNVEVIKLDNLEYEKGLNTCKFLDVEIEGVKQYAKVDILDGECYVRKQQGNTYNTFVTISGHVTSHAKMIMWECIEKAGLKNVYYMDTDSLFLNEEGYKNIEQAGLIHESELGKFKLESKIKWANFRGCKDYEYEDIDGVYQNKIKGVSSTAKMIEENIFTMRRPLTIADCKKDGDLYEFGSVYVTKHLSRIYKKGEVMDDKQVIPFELNEDLQTYLKDKFKRKKKYLKAGKKNENRD